MLLRKSSLGLVVGCTLVVGVMVPAQAGWAATLCVSHSSSSSCFRSIAAALASAPNGDTISVAAGLYTESSTVE
jgi:hypothetical protein